MRTNTPYWIRAVVLSVLFAIGTKLDRCLANPLGTWNLVYKNTPSQLTGLAYGNGTYLGVGGGLDYISHDGSNWTVYANPTFLNQSGVAYGNGVFVTFGKYVPNGPTYIFASTNGFIWQPVYTNSLSIYAAAYGNNAWVFIGPSPGFATNGFGIILTATINGSNSSWSQIASDAIYPESIAYLNGTFVMVLAFPSTGNYIFSSQDGITWQYTSPVPDISSEPFGASIAYGNGRYVYLSSFPEFQPFSSAYWSTNLLNWNLNDGSGWVEGSVGFYGNEFLIKRDNLVSASTNGYSWTFLGAVGAYSPSNSASSNLFLTYGQGALVASTSQNIYQSGVFVTQSNTPSTTLGISSYSGVTITGTPGGVYQIQYTTNLTSPWQTITNFLLPYSPYIWVDITTPVTGQRFYRSVQLQ